MPLAACIDEKILCMHGGISKDMQSFEQIEKIQKPTDVPDVGIIADLLWNDPDEDARECIKPNLTLLELLNLKATTQKPCFAKIIGTWLAIQNFVCRCR